MTWLALTLALVPLLDDRPPLQDLQRFPALVLIDAQLTANRAYHTLLTYRRDVERDRASALQAALDDTQASWWAWDWLRHAVDYADTAPHYSRTALGELRKRIGPEAYYAGHMPPCVPCRSD